MAAESHSTALDRSPAGEDATALEVRASRPDNWSLGHARAFLPVVAAVALLGAACGGSASEQADAAAESPASQAEIPTRDAYVTKAKAICARAWGEIPRGALDASVEAQLQMGMDTWAEVVRQLRALDRPPADAARIERMLTHFQNAIRAGRLMPTAEDEDALAVFAGLLDQGAKGAAIAHSFGLDDCSPVPPMPSAEDVFESEAYHEAMLDFIRQMEKDGKLPPLPQP
jgi:hypothetical protein